MKIPTICDYCGGKVIFTDSAIVYHGKSYGNIYYCTNCGAYVGVHDGTKKPPWDAGQRRPAEQAPGGPHLCPHGEKRRGKREGFLTEFYYFAGF